MKAMKMIDCKAVTTVTVKDPDTKLPVEVVIVKLDTGGMMGIDASFLANTEEPVYSCFDKGIEINVDDL
jgi:hypothetical protein